MNFKRQSRARKNRKNPVCAIYKFPYFDKKSGFAGLFAARLLLACVMCGTGAACFPEALKIEFSAGLACVTAMLSCAAFMLLCGFFGKIRTGAFTAACVGIAALFFHERLWEMCLNFSDAVIYACDGDFLRAGNYMDTAYFTSCSYDQTAAMLLLSAAFGMTAAFCASRRFRPEPILAFFIIVCIPSFISESAHYMSGAGIFAAALAGFDTINSSAESEVYLSEGAMPGVKLDDIQYRRSVKRAKPKQRFESDCYHYGKYLSQGMAVFVAAALIAETTAYIFPQDGKIEVKKAAEAIAEFGADAGDWFNDTFNISSSATKSFFSAEGGKINISGSIYYNDSPDRDRDIIEVVTQSTDKIYLRGDIGVDFDGTEWNSLADLDFDLIALTDADGDGDPVDTENPVIAMEKYIPEIEFYLYARNAATYLELYSGQFVNAQTVKINYLQKMSTVFMPGIPSVYNFRENENFTAYGDFVLTADKGRINSMETVALYPAADPLTLTTTFTDAYDYMNESEWEQTLGLSVTKSEYEELAEEYKGFVNKYYAKKNEEQSQNINYFLDQVKNYYDDSYSTDISFDISDYYSGTSVFFPSERAQMGVLLANYICDYLKSKGGYEYSRTTDNTLGDYDYLGNFLRETKSGHCALYATTMCLALREIGMPARYVTGFVVGGTPDYIDDDGCHYTLKSRNLHAWVEVYVEGVGWLPFDPTPSDYETIDNADPDETAASSTTAASSVSSGTTSSAAEASSERTVSSEKTSAPDSGGTSRTDAEKNAFDERALKAIVICAAAAVALLIIFMGIRGALKDLERKQKEKLSYLKNDNSPDAVRETLDMTLKILEMQGIRRIAGETPTDFAKRVDKEISRNDFLEEIMPLFERAEFAENAEFTSEEREKIFKRFKALLERLMLYVGAPKRLACRIKLFGKAKNKKLKGGK